MADHSERGPAAPAGSIVRPIYSVRHMRCYSVTESELQQIGLANIGSTVSVGIGSALFAFGVDIFKDTLLASGVPPQTKGVVESLQYFAIIFGFIFYAVAAGIWWWRRGMLNTIRLESADTGSATPASAPMAAPRDEPYGVFNQARPEGDQ